jgi:hypothetical protein
MNDRANNVLVASNDLAGAATIREALAKSAEAPLETIRFRTPSGGRTPYREEYRRNYGPDLDESLDGTESWHEFSAPAIRVVPF